MARGRKRLAKSTGLAIAAALLVAVLALVLRVAAPNTQRNLSNIVFDSYQRAMPRVWSPDVPVRIVDIDEESLKRHGQWPWSRALLASLTETIAEAGAAAIAFDFLFAEPDRLSPEQILTTLADTPARQALAKAIELTEPNDVRFARAIAATPSILAIALRHAGDTTVPIKTGFAVAGDDPAPFLTQFGGASLPLAAFVEVAKGLGSINWAPDRDQVLRRVPLVVSVGGHFVPAFAAEALRVAQGASTFVLRASNASGQTAFGASTGLNAVKIGAFDIPTDGSGAVLVRYTKTEPRRFLPAWTILNGDFSADALRGRIVLIGTSAAGLFDLRATPIDAAVPGVEIHAQVIEHMVSGDWLVRPDWAPGVEIVAALIGALLSAFLVAVLPVRVALSVAISLAAVFVLGSWLAFTRQGLLIDPVFPVGTAVMALFAASGTVIFSEQRARTRIRTAFSRYLAPDLVDELAADPTRLALGGEIREMTLLFSDIRGFTTLSEGMDAQTLTRFLNEFLTPMTDAILSRRGTIDKYMGDAVMAFWNAPVDDPDHARNACLSALDMIRRLDQFNEEHKGIAKVSMGVGLNTGDCCVGNLGSEQRFDYSVIGDDVNIASRLEGLTKFYGVQILAGETTVAAAGDGFVFLELDRVRVKGKHTALTVFALLGDSTLEQEIDVAALAGHQAEMLDAYRRCDWSAALTHLNTVSDASDGRLAAYVAAMSYRVAIYQTRDFPDGWDGVFDPESK